MPRWFYGYRPDLSDILENSHESDSTIASELTHVTIVSVSTDDSDTVMNSPKVMGSKCSSSEDILNATEITHLSLSSVSSDETLTNANSSSMKTLKPASPSPLVFEKNAGPSIAFGFDEKSSMRSDSSGKLNLSDECITIHEKVINDILTLPFMEIRSKSHHSSRTSLDVNNADSDQDETLLTDLSFTSTISNGFEDSFSNIGLNGQDDELNDFSSLPSDTVGRNRLLDVTMTVDEKLEVGVGSSRCLLDRGSSPSSSLGSVEVCDATSDKGNFTVPDTSFRSASSQDEFEPDSLKFEEFYEDPDAGYERVELPPGKW